MRHVLCAAGLLACPAVAVAQQPVPAALSLADAIAIAREQNPAYRQVLNNRGPAAWGTRSAYSSLLLPSVMVSGGVAYRSGPAALPDVELLAERPPCRRATISD